MRIVNLSYDDYANFAMMNCLALRSVGIDCDSYAMKKHGFNYAEHSEIVPADVIRKKAIEADLIQIFHSSDYIFNMVKNMGKRIFIYHTGTVYRQNPHKYNALFKDVERTFIDSPEFYTLGGKNVTYIATAIDTNKIQLRPSNNKRLVFAHYPSLPGTKGTDAIVKMMRDFPQAKFICDTKKLPHDENLKRIAECDVYIELFAGKQMGKDYGSFGVTAFEAAAMGKSVVTNSLHHYVYTGTYGQTGWLHVANTEEQFKETIHRILTNGIDPERPKKVREWIEQYHSLESTGNYLKQFL